jgi:hypothetical protein
MTPFNSEVTKVKSTKKGDRVLVIIVYMSDEFAKPSSVLFIDSIKHPEMGRTAFATNTQLMDACMDEAGRLLAVDNEGHLFSNVTLDIQSDSPLTELVINSPNNDLEIYPYRMTDSRLAAVWSDGKNILLATDDGTAIAITNNKQYRYDVCPDALKFHLQTWDNLYLLSFKNRLCHFDGVQWHEVALPETGLPYVAYTDALSVSGDDIIIVSTNGVVLRGNRKEGFTVIDVPVKKYTGIERIENRVFVTIRDEGLFEVTELDGYWQLHFMSKARLPLSLEYQDQSLIFSCAQESDKPYFGIAKLDEDIGELSHIVARSINFE